MKPMDDGRPISWLVRLAQEHAREWGAMFGAVFELSPDRSRISLAGRVLGTNKDHVLADSFMKVISDQMLEPLVSGKNGSMRIKGPKEALPYTRGTWHLCVITEQLNTSACVALMVELASDDQAPDHLARLAKQVVASLKPAHVKADAQSDRASDLKPDRRADLHFKALFKTCEKLSGHALLIAGQRGFVIDSSGLRQMKSIVLSQEALHGLIQEVLPGAGRQMDIPGVMQFDVISESGVMFRIAVLGQPEPRAIAITLLAKDAPPIAADRQEWSHAEGNWYACLKQTIVGKNRQIILLDNSPPLIWSDQGIQAVPAKILLDNDVREFASQCVKLEQSILNPNGYMEYGIGIGGAQFRTYLFDYFTSPMNVLVKRQQKKTAE